MFLKIDNSTWRPGRVPTAQGKQGKWPKIFPVRENREFGNFVKTQGKHREFLLNTGKTQGILSAQVVNVLILKVNDIAMVAPKNPIFFQKLNRSAKSVYVILTNYVIWHRENLQSDRKTQGI